MEPFSTRNLFNFLLESTKDFDLFEKEFPDLGLIKVHNSESNERVWID